MRYDRVTKASQIVLDGVRVDVEIVNKVLQSVTLTDASGHSVRFRTDNNYSNLNAAVPTPPATVEKHVVIGSLLGVPVREEFTEKYEAVRRAEQLESDVRGDASIKVVIEQVPVSDDEIPF